MGADFTQVDGDSYLGYHKKGIQAGGAVYMMLGEDVGLCMELLYTQKGSRSNAIGVYNGSAVTKYSIALNYAEVPVLLYFFTKKQHHFGAGFSYGQLVQHNELIETAPHQDIDLTSYPFRKADLSFVLGSNVHLWKGLYFGARFQYSMLSVRNNVPADLGRPSQFNNVWAFRVMYLL